MNGLIDPAIPGPHHLRGIFARPWFFGLEGGGSAGGGGTDTDGNGGGDTPPNTQGGGDDDSNNSSDETPKFTQAQVDALIGQAKDKAARGKLDPKELGFQSRKEMESFIEAQRQKEKESQTEAERALEEAREAAKTEAKTEILTKAQQIAVRSEFKVKAHEAGIPADRIDDALALAKNLKEWESVESDEDGNVAGLDDDFFKTLKESKSWLFAVVEDGGSGDDGGTPPPAGNRAGGGNTESPNEAKLKETYSALR